MFRCAALPSSIIVDSATELTPTVSASNNRAATTQYSRPTPEVRAELSTSARPSRCDGLSRPSNLRGGGASCTSCAVMRRTLAMQVQPHVSELPMNGKLTIRYVPGAATGLAHSGE
jgi:hypothetical protein